MCGGEQTSCIVWVGRNLETTLLQSRERELIKVSCSTLALGTDLPRLCERGPHSAVDYNFPPYLDGLPFPWDSDPLERLWYDMDY